MTAIKPAQLKRRVNQLVNLLDNPNKFINEIYKLFDVYADRVTRINHGGRVTSVLKVYNVPGLVLREIYQRISDRYKVNWQQLLEIAQRLWDEECLETKILAIEFILRLTYNKPESSILLINDLALLTEEDRLLDRMAKIGLNLADMKKFDLIDSLAEEWLSSDQIKFIRLGMKMLSMILDQKNYDNIPKLFFLISGSIHDWGEELDNDLFLLFSSLISYSPKETVLFIKTNSSFRKNMRFRRIVRKLSKVIPDPEKTELESYFRNSRHTNKI